MEVWVQETRTETQPLHWPPPWESSGRAVECLYSDSISHDEVCIMAKSVVAEKYVGTWSQRKGSFVLHFGIGWRPNFICDKTHFL